MYSTVVLARGSTNVHSADVYLSRRRLYIPLTVIYFIYTHIIIPYVRLLAKQRSS